MSERTFGIRASVCVEGISWVVLGGRLVTTVHSRIVAETTDGKKLGEFRRSYSVAMV